MGGLGSLGGGGLPIPAGRGGCIGLVVTLLVVVLGGGALLSGGGGSGGGGSGTDIGLPDVFNQLPNGQPAPSGANLDATAPDSDEKVVDFVSFVIDDVNGFWDGEFKKAGQTYSPTRLVLFSRGVQTGCGAASSATGPFYCPVDRNALITFLTIAIVVFFLVVKPVNALLARLKQGQGDESEAPAEDVLILQEIRDLLRDGPDGRGGVRAQPRTPA